MWRQYLLLGQLRSFTQTESPVRQMQFVAAHIHEYGFISLHNFDPCIIGW